MVKMKAKTSVPVFLKNPIQHYAWGERGPEAFIPRLLGIPAEADTPYAELWIGAHPSAPSRVVLAEEEIPLIEWIAENPGGILGKRVVRKFGPQLPFLLKVLSAAEALSIQEHPNKKQAEELHARDPEHYPDANHKPEIAVALDGLKALAGFRNFISTREVLRRYPEIANFIGQPAKNAPPDDASIEEKRRWIRNIYVALIEKSQAKPEALKETLHRLDVRFRKQASPANFQEELYGSLRRKYGDDVGLLSLFLLQFMDLHPGEAFFTPAGIPHAYLRGNIVECMANSDNVVRAGLTQKFKDLNTMVDILTPNPETLPLWKPERNAEQVIYDAPIEEFRVTRLNLSAGKLKTVGTEASVRILLVIEGNVLLQWGEGKSLSVQKGKSILIPASVSGFRLLSRVKSLVFVVDVPVG